MKRREEFFAGVESFLSTVNREEYCLVAVDLEHFRLYNQIHGHEDGDLLLRTISDILEAYRDTYDGVAGYLGGDNFCLLTIYDKSIIGDLFESIRNEIWERNNTVGYRPALGVYHIGEEPVAAEEMYEHALVALSHVTGDYTATYCEYYPEMDRKQEEEIRLLTEIQKAMDADEFTFFIQPQCDFMKSQIVGGESLVRWIRKDGTMVSPGVFVPVLEKNGFIADLDNIVWEKVCQWIRTCLDGGYRPVPISINVSRIDIYSMDVPQYLLALTEKYRIDPSYLKVEITESAYAENEGKITETVKELQKFGFLVLMDDFGSGYSSLNMLKEVSVDVLKMDMRFLETDDENEKKGWGILESIVNMARQMQIPVVVEGVETKKHETWLKRMGCRYAQGYYYYKPMPTEAFEELLADESNVDHRGFWCRQSEALRMRELMDASLFTDATINNLLGAMAFYDMHENNIEITRVNEQYLHLAKAALVEDESYQKRFWNHVRDDDRYLLFSIFDEASRNPERGADGHIHFVCQDGETIYVHIRVFFLNEKDGHKNFCATLAEVKEQERKPEEGMGVNFEREGLSEAEMAQLEKAYGNVPCGYGIGHLILNDDGTPIDYKIVYANKDLRRLSGGDGKRLQYMVSLMFADHVEELLAKAYRCAYSGTREELHVYSHISSRYLDMTMSQYQPGYVSCIVQDVTHSHIFEDALNRVKEFYRAMYFLQLQDNYCRMIYPDEDNLLERGVFEEVVNRHFDLGKILAADEELVRNFLSLENLRKELAHKNSIECKYRRQVDDAGEEWCLTTIMVNERKDGVPITATIVIRSIEALMREQENNKFHNMAAMLSQMSEGFFVYRATEGEEILYANPPVLHMFGCKNVQEFEELVNESFQGMVYKEDRKRVQWEISEQVNHSDQNMDFITYRIIAKDGSVRWVDDCGHLEDISEEKDGKLFYVFITDVTDTITEARKNKIYKLNKKFNQE